MGCTFVSQARSGGRRENPVFKSQRGVTLGGIMHCFTSFILCCSLFLDLYLVPQKLKGSDNAWKVPNVHDGH